MDFGLAALLTSELDYVRPGKVAFRKECILQLIIRTAKLIQAIHAGKWEYAARHCRQQKLREGIYYLRNRGSFL